MAEFLTPLRVEVLGGYKFKLLEPLLYDNNKILITIYPDFIFDGASIPKVLWSLVGCPIGDSYSRAACLHDALYASRLFRKRECDILFYQAMLSDGVSKVKAREFYYAVK